MSNSHIPAEEQEIYPFISDKNFDELKTKSDEIAQRVELTAVKIIQKIHENEIKDTMTAIRFIKAALLSIALCFLFHVATEIFIL